MNPQALKDLEKYVTTCSSIPKEVQDHLITITKDKVRLSSIYGFFAFRQQGKELDESEIKALHVLCKGIVLTDFELKLRACEMVPDNQKERIVEISEDPHIDKRTQRLINKLKLYLEHEDFTEVRSLCDRLCTSTMLSFSELLDDDEEFYCLTFADKEKLKNIAADPSHLEKWQLKQLHQLEEYVITGDYETEKLQQLVKCVCKFPSTYIKKQPAVLQKYKTMVSICRLMGVPEAFKIVDYTSNQKELDLLCEQLYTEVVDRKDPTKTINNSSLFDYDKYILTTAVASMESHPSLVLNTSLVLYAIEKYGGIPTTITLNNKIRKLIDEITSVLVTQGIVKQSKINSIYMLPFSVVVLGYTLLVLACSQFTPLSVSPLVAVLLFSLPITFYSWILCNMNGDNYVMLMTLLVVLILNIPHMIVYNSTVPTEITFQVVGVMSTIIVCSSISM